eukprot:5351511-Amphidinium_carterae.1
MWLLPEIEPWEELTVVGMKATMYNAICCANTCFQMLCLATLWRLITPKVNPKLMKNGVCSSLARSHIKFV